MKLVRHLRIATYVLFELGPAKFSVGHRRRRSSAVVRGGARSSRGQTEQIGALGTPGLGDQEGHAGEVEIGILKGLPQIERQARASNPYFGPSPCELSALARKAVVVASS